MINNFKNKFYFNKIYFYLIHNRKYFFYKTFKINKDVSF